MSGLAGIGYGAWATTGALVAAGYMAPMVAGAALVTSGATYFSKNKVENKTAQKIMGGIGKRGMFTSAISLGASLAVGGTAAMVAAPLALILYEGGRRLGRKIF